MDIKGKVVIVTGGASGIGEALCRRFAKEGAEAVYVVDMNGERAKAVAEAIGGVGVGADVSKEAEITDVVRAAEKKFGRVDIVCSNAGILVLDKDNVASSSNADWQRIWEVNLMAHVYAVRAALPGMIARGEGYFVHTASAAGLLSQIGSAPYSVTKHAAVGFAESVAIAHGDDGIRVSVLCPQAVRTAMILGSEEGGVAGGDGVIEPEDVAKVVVDAIREERFLILPHPQVLTYMQRKTSDYDRWIKGMQRLRRKYVGAVD